MNKDEEYWAYDEFIDGLSDSEWEAFKQKRNGNQKATK